MWTELLTIIFSTEFCKLHTALIRCAKISLYMYVLLEGSCAILNSRIQTQLT